MKVEKKQKGLTRRQALALLTASAGAAGYYVFNPAIKNGFGAGTEFDLTSEELTYYFDQTSKKLPTLLKPDEFVGDSCKLISETYEGPYYFGVKHMRRDITEGREGLPVQLGIRVVDKDCNPVENALVDIWHCDAKGYYSGFPRKNPEDAMPKVAWELMTKKRLKPAEESFLRGIQATNADGIVEFQTIYPGWYASRTLHIHAKIYLDEKSEATTEFYFDDAVTEEIFETFAPYNTRNNNNRSSRNSNDGLYSPDRHLDYTATEGRHRGLVTVRVES